MSTARCVCERLFSQDSFSTSEGIPACTSCGKRQGGSSFSLDESHSSCAVSAGLPLSSVCPFLMLLAEAPMANSTMGSGWAGTLTAYTPCLHEKNEGWGSVPCAIGAALPRYPSRRKRKPLFEESGPIRGVGWGRGWGPGT